MIIKDKIYTETAARGVLQIKEQTTLQNLRRRRKIKGFRQGREWFYTGYSLIQYLRDNGVYPCEESQDSSGTQTGAEISSLITGTSTSMTEKEEDASLLGVKLARRTMRQTSPSQPSH